MNSILSTIAAYKKTEVQQAKKERQIRTEDLKHCPKPRDFIQPLYTHAPAIIAEIKKASPSKGIIREDFDVATIAEIYTQHGAACLSVLTDAHFFQGANHYLRIAKEHSTLPALRKDFIIDEWQIMESRILDADCILLIVSLLDDAQLSDYCQQAQELGMAVLVESHTEAEFERALRLPTPLMGVNNRSLHSFTTDIQTSVELSKLLPADKILIAESGIHTHKDIEYLSEHSIQRFLIGESLMREQNIGDKLAEFLRESR